MMTATRSGQASGCCVAGVDEAGRGPWAGPVVAAAVILHRHSLPVRIDDSKRLTAAARARAFDVILTHADVGVGILSAEEIDRHNILQATLLAMAHAVRDLPVQPDRVLVDGTHAPALSMPCHTLIHGDSRHYVISCASIIAKVVRDRLMDFYHELYPDYRFNQHRGYGTSLHAQRLSEFGPSFLHRRSFRPVMEAMQCRMQSRKTPVSVAAGSGRSPAGGRVLPLRDPTAILAQRLSHRCCDRAAGGEEVPERAGAPAGRPGGPPLGVTRPPCAAR